MANTYKPLLLPAEMSLRYLPLKTGHVVPGRHDRSMFLLGGIPGRRDVSLRTLEDHEGIDACAKVCELQGVGQFEIRFSGRC